MTQRIGTVKPGSTIYIYFDTFAGSTGASVTMSGLAVTDIEIYKNGSVTQRSSDTGYTLLDTDGIDFDSLTGIHGFSVDLSSNADSGFFVAGGRYSIVVSAITIDSQTVSFVAATFDIGYPGAVIDTTIATLSTQTSFTLTAGPAEDDALNGCVVVIHDIASAVQLGYAVIQDYTGSSKTVTLVAGVTFTAAAGDNISIFPPALQPTVWGRTADFSSGGEVGLDWANIGSPTTTVGLSGTTVKDATDVNTDTDTLLSRMGTPSNLGGGATLAANLSDIESQTDDIGTAGAGLTDLGGMSTTMKAQVESEANDALVGQNLDHLAKIAVDTNFATTVHLDSIIGHLADNGSSATFDRTTDSLEALQAEHDATQSAVDTVDNFLDTEIATLITNTGNIETDTQDIQSRLPAALVSGKMDSDATAISGDTTAADNLEKQFDGTGYGHILQRTTIATLSSQTSFTLTAGSADNDAYNGCIIVIEDASTAAQKAVGVVGDYTGSTKTITLLNDPAVFTMATTDIVTLIADRALKPTVDNRTADVSAGGEVGVDWANVGSPTTTVNLSGTTVKTATDVETDTQDIQSRLGTPSNLGSGASVAANLVDIESQTDDIGTAGAGLTDLGGMSTTMKGQVQTEAEDALVTHRVDELLNADSDIDGAAPPTVGSVFHELMTKTAGSFTYDQTTDALEAVRDRGDAAWTTATGFSTHSAADVWAVATRTLTAFDSSFKTGYALSAAGVQAIWDALTSALTTVGSIGKYLVDAFASRAEPGQGAPPASASVLLKIDYLYKSWRNKKTQTSTTRSLYADDGTTVDQKATDSDDATTYTKGEMGTGP